LAKIGAELAGAIVWLNHAEPVEHSQREICEMHGRIPDVGVVHGDSPLSFSDDFCGPTQVVEANVLVDSGDSFVSLLSFHGANLGTPKAANAEWGEADA
jgi:hypothetical protein